MTFLLSVSESLPTQQKKLSFTFLVIKATLHFSPRSGSNQRVASECSSAVYTMTKVLILIFLLFFPSAQFVNSLWSPFKDPFHPLFSILYNYKNNFASNFSNPCHPNLIILFRPSHNISHTIVTNSIELSTRSVPPRFSLLQIHSYIPFPCINQLSILPSCITHPTNRSSHPYSNSLVKLCVLTFPLFYFAPNSQLYSQWPNFYPDILHQSSPRSEVHPV